MNTNDLIALKDQMQQLSSTIQNMSYTLDSAISSGYDDDMPPPNCSYVSVWRCGSNDPKTGQWIPDHNVYYIDDVFRSFTGNVYLWKWVNGSWSPEPLDILDRYSFQVDSNIYKSFDKIERSNKMNTILNED